MSSMQKTLEMIAATEGIDIDPFRIIPGKGVEKFAYEASIVHATGAIMKLIADINTSQKYEVIPSGHSGVEQFYISIGLKKVVTERSRFSRIVKAIGILYEELDQNNSGLPIASVYYIVHNSANKPRATLVLKCKDNPATLHYRQEILTMFSIAYHSTRAPLETSPAHLPLQIP